jgi:uncharacterized iron-regulated membrane protein
MKRLALSVLLLSAPAAASAAETALARAEARLQRAGFQTIGEARRKGGLIIVEASRGGHAWRLVVDSRTGEIVGQRPTSGGAPVGD